MADKPLRHFRGIGVSQSSLVSLLRKHKDGDDLKKAIVESEKDLKICCSPYDEQGESIYCEEDDILIGRYGASVGKILTGLSGAYNVALMKTKPNQDLINKKFLCNDK